MKFDFLWLTFTGEGQGHCFLKLIQNNGRVVARAEFGDLEQQGGQGIDDQQNSNPQQGTVYLL